MRRYATMDVQSMCIGHEIGELSEDLLALSDIPLRSYSSRSLKTSPIPHTTLHDFKTTQNKATKAASKRKHPNQMNSSAVQQADLAPIAPKFHSTVHPRRYRPQPRAKADPSRRDLSLRAGVLYSTRIYNTSGMAEADLLYMRMTSAERIDFELPGRCQFQNQEREHKSFKTKCFAQL